MIERLLLEILSRLGIEQKNVDKVKKILDKIEFIEKDDKNFMVIKIGEGIELTITQQKNQD